MGLLERYKCTSNPPLSSPRRLLRLTEHRRTANDLKPLAIGIDDDGEISGEFLPLMRMCHPASCKPALGVMR